MNAHEFINNELDFDLMNPYAHTEEEIISKLDGGCDAVDNEPIKEAYMCKFMHFLGFYKCVPPYKGIYYDYMQSFQGFYIISLIYSFEFPPKGSSSVLDWYCIF